MLVRELLNPSRAVQPSPFGAQSGDGILLAPDFVAQLGDALNLARRFEFDLVYIRGREQQRGDHAEIEDAHHREPPAISAMEGNRGRSLLSIGPAGAPVRSAARSFAERARGLAVISASSGTTGRLTSSLNVALRSAAAGL